MLNPNKKNPKQSNQQTQRKAEETQIGTTTVIRAVEPIIGTTTVIKSVDAISLEQPDEENLKVA